LIKGLQGKGKDENKKLEGSNFGFQKFGIVDYPLLYLERLVKIFVKDSKNKLDFVTSLADILFEDILIDLISSPNYKNDISPRGYCALFNSIHDLIIADYKIIPKKMTKVKIFLTYRRMS
jgi:hypothetical protein